jgi:hypothetical protein
LSSKLIPTAPLFQILLLKFTNKNRTNNLNIKEKEEKKEEKKKKKKERNCLF